MNTSKISYGKYIAEIIGVIILSLVVAYAGQLGNVAWVLTLPPIALMLIVYLFGGVSGAHVNPAFTISAWSMKKIGWRDAVLYLCSQFIGAGIALMILKQAGVQLMDFSAVQTPASTLFFAEVVGTTIFSLAFAAVLHKQTSKDTSGLTVGVGLMFGIMFALICHGVGALNPAVAIAINAINWALILGPIVGALIGTWLYKAVIVLSKANGSVCDCDCGCHNKSANSSATE